MYVVTELAQSGFPCESSGGKFLGRELGTKIRVGWLDLYSSSKRLTLPPIVMEVENSPFGD